MFRAWATRSCSDCRRYMYRHSEDGGLKRTPATDPSGVIDRRPPRAPLPCGHGPAGSKDRCPKIPLDVVHKCPEAAVELSEKNRRALQHYMEAHAVGGFLEWERADWIVRRNAVIIRKLFEEVERRDLALTLLSLRLGLRDGNEG